MQSPFFICICSYSAVKPHSLNCAALLQWAARSALSVPPPSIAACLTCSASKHQFFFFLSLLLRRSRSPTVRMHVTHIPGVWATLMNRLDGFKIVSSKQYLEPAPSCLKYSSRNYGNVGFSVLTRTLQVPQFNCARARDTCIALDTMFLAALRY